jgi:hypothetical protein
MGRRFEGVYLGFSMALWVGLWSSRFYGRWICRLRGHLVLNMATVIGMKHLERGFLNKLARIILHPNWINHFGNLETLYLSITNLPIDLLNSSGQMNFAFTN